MEKFPEAFAAIRAMKGFSSSRSFYNQNGGVKFFRCTYRHLLNVEAGRAMPGVELLEKIAAALGIVTERPLAKRFITAYLRDTFKDSEDLVSLVRHALVEPSDRMEGSKSKLVESMARVNQERVVNLTRKQSEWIADAPEHYWTWTILAHDDGEWDASVLAETTGFEKPKIDKALAALVKLGLIKKNKTLFRCPNAGAVFQHPGTKIYSLGVEQLGKYRDAMAGKRGKDLMRYYFFSRGPEAELKQYFDYLAKAVQGVDVVSSKKKVDDSIFFEVETRVRRVLPF